MWVGATTGDTTLPQVVLDVVLILSERFETLESNCMRILCIKTVFLLTLATAGRVSEIHALSALPQCLRFSRMALLR